MPDATELVLVQHAEKERAPGDPSLTDRGRRQAAATATHLARFEWDALYCSPALRARGTAQAIEMACGLDAAVDDRLRERMNWGSSPELQTVDEFLADWQRATADRSWTPPSGDSSLATGARVREALTEFAATADSRVLVVGHGGATVDLLRTLLGDETLYGIAPTVISDGVPNCALTHLTFDQSWHVRNIAEVGHLVDL